MKTAGKKSLKVRESPVRRFLHFPQNPQFLLEGALLVGTIAYLFYDSPIAAGILSPLLIPYYRRRSREKRQREQKELAGQFREALAAIIMIAASVVSFINPFTGFHLLVIFLGISLIIDGVWDIFTMFYLRSLVKKFKKGINNSKPGKSSADFVDAEINQDDYDDGFDE